MNRRKVLQAIAAVATGGGALAIPAELDPVFAAIEAHKRALAEHEAFCLSVPEPEDDSPDYAAWWNAGGAHCDAENAAAWAMLYPGPTTLAGVAALLEYVAASRHWPERHAEGSPPLPLETEAMNVAAAALKRIAQG